MPLIQSPNLREIIEALFVASGVPEKDAITFSRLSVGANLAGHDSHGVIQVPSYIDRIRRGHIDPKASYDVIKDTSTTTVVDGNWGIGYVVTERLMKTTIEKAKTQNIAAATVFRQSHVGRLGAYPLMAAAEDMIAFITADSGRSAKAVVPFGGRDKRLGTNPISFAIPSNLEGPYFLDMATSAVAAGKINLANARNEKVPLGWIVDGNGNQTTDPEALSNGGAILPLGGPEGHKGYGLSSVVEIFSGLLTGLGFGHDPSGRHNDGCFMAVFNVAAFRELEDFKKEVTEFAMYLKSSEPAPGYKEVFYPGEIEHLREKELLKTGIPIEESTWASLMALVDQYGIRESLSL